MTAIGLTLGILLQAAPVAGAEEVRFDRLYVRDSGEAARVEVDDPAQEVCVRKLLPGSRVKARTMCQDQASWKAYLLAVEDMADEWADTGRALRSDEMLSGAPAGRGYAPGGGPSRPPR